MPIHWHVLRRADRGRDGICLDSGLLRFKLSSFNVLVGDVRVEVSSMIGIERLVTVFELVTLFETESLGCLIHDANFEPIVEKSSDGIA